MINRTYIVKMPTEAPTSALNILVRSDPGTQDEPVVADGRYYELRGRPIRFETVSGDSGFVPRCALGYQLAITAIDNRVDVPSVQLSASLIQDLSSGDGSMVVPTLADPGGEPAIQLVGTANTAGNYYQVTIAIAEAKDEDRTSTAAP